MAIQRTVRRVCDRCSSELKVDHYKVVRGRNEKTFSFDACSSCYAEAPLREWESLKGGSGRLRRQVVSPDVVERAVRKAPKKRTAKKG